MEKTASWWKSQTKGGEGGGGWRERGEERRRMERGREVERDGCTVRLMDGWRTESTEKVERNKRKGGGGREQKRSLSTYV